MKRVVIFFKKVLKKIGLRVERYQPWMNNYNWLEEYEIRTVIDIGANVGDFAKEFRNILPNAKILCFEPIPSIFKKLVFNLGNLDNIEFFNMGLGKVKETTEINVNEFSPSSSLLELSEYHYKSYSFARDTKKETIKIERLDDVLKLYEIDKNILIKIDVQGFEDKVIAGGAAIIQSASVILIEISFVELYKSQLKFKDINRTLESMGFVYNGSQNQNYDNSTGRILYADAIYINEK